MENGLEKKFGLMTAICMISDLISFRDTDIITNLGRMYIAKITVDKCAQIIRKYCEYIC